MKTRRRQYAGSGWTAVLSICLTLASSGATSRAQEVASPLSEADYLQRLTREPDNAEHYVGLARLLMSEGRPERARTLLEPAAARWVERGEYTAAIAVLELLVEAEPTVGRHWADLGRARALGRQHAGALEALERAMEHGAADRRTRLMLASALWENGRIDEAERMLRELRAEGPSPLVSHYLGTLLLWAGRFEESATELEQVLAARPDWLVARLDLARALEGAGRPGDARREFERYLERYPGDPGARYGLATSLLALGEREAAREQMEIYGEIRAREREVLRDEGRLTAALDEASYLVADGRPAEALERLETLPQEIRVLEALSLAWQAAGEPAKALAALEQAVALDPSRLDLRVRLQDLRAPRGGE